MSLQWFVHIKLFLAMTRVISPYHFKPYAICKKYAKPSCESIFFWNNNRSNFLSLFNVTLLNEIGYNSKSIQGSTVRVIADNMLPYITSSNYSQKLGGFLGEIWQLIESTLQFKSNVSSVYYDTGLELITTGQADVMLAAVVQKKGLLNVKYSQPYFYNWYHLFIKTPKPRASALSYLNIFDDTLWFTILGIFLLLTLTVWITTKLLNERQVSMVSCFLGMISGTINQGFDLKLSSYAGRMQVMFALILGVVLYSGMNAVLVAQLAVFDIAFPFKSLNEIANKRTHSLCLRSNSFVYNNFTGQNKTVLRYWSHILNHPPCLDITIQANLAEILCKDGLVVLENRAVMEMILKNYNISCSIINSAQRLFETGNYFLLRKSFVHKNLINNILLKMRDAGILQQLENIWMRREKLDNLQSQVTPQVTLDHIVGVLLTYAIMILTSLIILLFEILYFNRHRKRTILRRKKAKFVSYSVSIDLFPQNKKRQNKLHEIKQ